MAIVSLVPLLAVLQLLVSPAQAFDELGYQPASLAAWEKTVRESEGFSERANSFVADAEFPKLASQVVFTGRSRPIAGAKLQFISYFAAKVAEKPQLASLYVDELEVREQGRLYWVCVQKTDWPARSKSIRAGGRFKIYHRFAGVMKGKDFVYLVQALKVQP